MLDFLFSVCRLIQFYSDIINVNLRGDLIVWLLLLGRHACGAPVAMVPTLGVSATGTLRWH